MCDVIDWQISAHAQKWKRGEIYAALSAGSPGFSPRSDCTVCVCVLSSEIGLIVHVRFVFERFVKLCLRLLCFCFLSESSQQQRENQPFLQTLFFKYLHDFSILINNSVHEKKKYCRLICCLCRILTIFQAVRKHGWVIIAFCLLFGIYNYLLWNEFPNIVVWIKSIFH